MPASLFIYERIHQDMGSCSLSSVTFNYRAIQAVVEDAFLVLRSVYRLLILEGM